MLQRWMDHNNQEQLVRDCYQRNKMLIDLTAQPENIKQAIDDSIRKGVRRVITPSVGVHFLKLCGKYDLQKISEQADTYARWLNEPYTGKLEETVNV
jgi:hypothetical protein